VQLASSIVQARSEQLEGLKRRWPVGSKVRVHMAEIAWPHRYAGKVAHVHDYENGRLVVRYSPYDLQEWSEGFVRHI
jgi:hypothetical protein